MHRGALAAASLTALLLAGCGTQAAPSPVRSNLPLRVARTVRARVSFLPARPEAASAIAMLSPTIGYAIANDPDSTSQSWLLTTVDGGRTWRVGTAFGAAVSTLQFVNPRDGFALTQAALLGTVDGGRHWRTLNRQELKAVRFASVEDGLAVNSRQALLVTADGGRTWRPAAVPKGLRFDSVSALPGPRYFALATRTLSAEASVPVLLTSFGGQRWTTLFSGVTSPPLAAALRAWVATQPDSSYILTHAPTFGWGQVTFTTPQDGWLSLFDGGYLATLVARTADGGRSFTFAWGNGGCAMGCNAAGLGLYPAAYLGAESVWRYDGQSIDRSADGGRTFAAGGPLNLAQAASSAVRETQFVTPELGFAATTAGLFRTTDSGANWQRVWPEGPGPLGAAAVSAQGFGLAASSALPGRLWGSADGGRTWHPLPGPRVRGAAFDVVWAFGRDQGLVEDQPHGALYATRDGGRSWRRVDLRLPPLPQYTEPQYWFGSLKDGWLTAAGLHRAVFYATRDGGRTWARVGNGAVKEFGPITCAPLASGDGWCLSGTKGPTKAAQAWKLTLAATGDRARTFVPVGTMPMLGSGNGIGFASRAQGALLTTSGLLVTSDAARSFTRILMPEPKSLFLSAVFFFSPTSMDVLTGDGRLLRTMDGGRHWRQIS